MTLSDDELSDILSYLPADRHPRLLYALGYASGKQRRHGGGMPSMEASGVDVAKVRALYATGRYTHRSLAEELNAQGFPTARGGKWWANTVRAALGGR